VVTGGCDEDDEGKTSPLRHDELSGLAAKGQPAEGLESEHESPIGEMSSR
jgi:hypothetical protein